MAVFAGFAPFAWREGGTPRGRDVAFLRRFAAAEGWGFAVKFFDFDRLWEQPAQGNVDVAASGISRRPTARTAGVAWSRPYAAVRRSLVVREADRKRFRGPRDLRDARLAVVRGSAADSHARRMLPGAAVEHCETLERGIDDLLAGRVDAVGTGDISARHHLSIRRGLAMTDVHGDAPEESIAFSVDHTNRSLLRRLDAFIRRAAGSY